MWTWAWGIVALALPTILVGLAVGGATRRRLAVGQRVAKAWRSMLVLVIRPSYEIGRTTSSQILLKFSCNLCTLGHVQRN